MLSRLLRASRCISIDLQTPSQTLHVDTRPTGLQTLVTNITNVRGALGNIVITTNKRYSLHVGTSSCKPSPPPSLVNIHISAIHHVPSDSSLNTHKGDHNLQLHRFRQVLRLRNRLDTKPKQHSRNRSQSPCPPLCTDIYSPRPRPYHYRATQ